MPLITILTGLLLAALGVFAYLGSDMRSLHPLGPAFLGLLLVGFGIAARSPGMKKHAMHGAAVIGLLGLLGTIGGAFAMSRRGSLSIGPGRAVVASVVIFFVFESLCVLSFIAARKARQAGTAA